MWQLKKFGYHTLWHLKFFLLTIGYGDQIFSIAKPCGDRIFLVATKRGWLNFFNHHRKGVNERGETHVISFLKINHPPNALLGNRKISVAIYGGGWGLSKNIWHASLLWPPKSFGRHRKRQLKIHFLSPFVTGAT